ncbi:MAG: hypothetical protein ACRCV9_13830, partial [Burkholderiaceae bacterium]
ASGRSVSMSAQPVCDVDFAFAKADEQTRQILHAHNAKELPVAQEYARRVVSRPSGELTLRFDSYALAAGSQVRTMAMYSSKLDIYTLFFYPDYAQSAPIYAMEFVQIGGRPVVAVLDLISLCGNPQLEPILDDWMSSARRGVSADNARDMPQWFIECRSGREVFLRPESSAQFEVLSDMHLELFEKILNVQTRCERIGANGIAEHRDEIAKYKHHHWINSPGLPLMKTTFGQTWSDEFMGQHMFA